MKKYLAIALVLLISMGFTSKNEVKITVRNLINIKRVNETVEVNLIDISKFIKDAEHQSFVVIDGTGKEIPSQLIYGGGKVPQKLIFQVSVSEKGAASYSIKIGMPNEFQQKTFGRFVPERFDDYAWENDRIAYRIYGLALIPKDGPSNGIDVWVKRTDQLVIDKWYGDYTSSKGKISYHKDSGEGCDCYKVGRTLGAGGMAPFVNDSLWLGINFQSHQTLDNGQIRTSFKLVYPTFNVNGKMVTETRTFSLDAGYQLSSITEEYNGYDAPMTVAAGIVRKEGKTILQSPEKGYITYGLPCSEGGTIYIGVVFKAKATGVAENKDHILLKTNYNTGDKLQYYAGAGWSKWGFDTEESWNKYVDEFALKVKNPLIIELK
jgi:hypothetical protein